MTGTYNAHVVHPAQSRKYCPAMAIIYIEKTVCKDGNVQSYLPLGNSNLASIRILCPVGYLVPATTPLCTMISLSRDNHCPSPSYNKIERYVAYYKCYVWSIDTNNKKNKKYHNVGTIPK
jgi:hypothetical protein